MTISTSKYMYRHIHAVYICPYIDIHTCTSLSMSHEACSTGTTTARPPGCSSRRDVTCGCVPLSVQGRVSTPSACSLRPLPPPAPSAAQHSAAVPAPSISVPRAGRRSNVERSTAVMDLLLKPLTLCSQRSCRGHR